MLIYRFGFITLHQETKLLFPKLKVRQNPFSKLTVKVRSQITIFNLEFLVVKIHMYNNLSESSVVGNTPWLKRFNNVLEGYLLPCTTIFSEFEFRALSIDFTTKRFYIFRSGYLINKTCLLFIFYKQHCVCTTS